MQYLCGITYILALIFTVVTTMARPYDNSFRDVYETEPIFQVSIKISTCCFYSDGLVCFLEVFHAAELFPKFAKIKKIKK